MVTMSLIVIMMITITTVYLALYVYRTFFTQDDTQHGAYPDASQRSGSGKQRQRSRAVTAARGSPSKPVKRANTFDSRNLFGRPGSNSKPWGW